MSLRSERGRPQRYDQGEKQRRTDPMSAWGQKPTKGRVGELVRFVPKADVVHGADVPA